MNKHFHDSLYYLERASHHVVLGVKETTAPVVDRFRERVGHESETEPTRLERVRDVVSSFERRVRNRGRRTIGAARGVVSRGRTDDVEPDR